MGDESWPHDSADSWDQTDDCCVSACGGANDGCGGGLLLGDGDCDSDDDCGDGLVCGTDNCGKFRRHHASWPHDSADSWDETDDCCEEEEIAQTKLQGLGKPTFKPHV